VKSGELILKPKETRNQVSKKMYQKMVLACDEYLRPFYRKKMKKKLKKTSKMLAKILFGKKIS
jgi:hypothetical protein